MEPRCSKVDFVWVYRKREKGRKWVEGQVLDTRSVFSDGSYQVQLADRVAEAFDQTLAPRKAATIDVSDSTATSEV